MIDKLKSSPAADGSPPFLFWNSIRLIRIDPKNVVYKGCVTQDCLKKLEEDENGSMICQKCQLPESGFKWRYSVKFQLKDDTATLFATGFDSVAEILLGQSAELTAALSEDELEAFLQSRIQASQMDSFRILFSARLIQSVGASQLTLVARRIDNELPTESPSSIA